MLSKITLVLALFAILFTSCKNEQLISQEKPVEKEIKMKSVKFQDMNAQMPEDYPDELINYNYTDLKQIASEQNWSGNSNLRVIPGNSFDEIVENVKKKYPDFENAEPEEYKRFFPDLTDRELIEKRDSIFQYMERLMGYEVAIAMAALERNGRTGVEMRTMYESNSCEQWYYASHLRLDNGGMHTAQDLAYAKGGYGTDDRSDANRHACWNVYLGKYAAYRYATVGEATDIVLGLTNAHECDTPQNKVLNSEMDLFNNKVGLLYFSQIAERYKKNIFDYNVRVTKSDDEIFGHISSLNDRIVASSAEINNGTAPTILVKLK